MYHAQLGVSPRTSTTGYAPPDTTHPETIPEDTQQQGQQGQQGQQEDASDVAVAAAVAVAVAAAAEDAAKSAERIAQLEAAEACVASELEAERARGCQMVSELEGLRARVPELEVHVAHLVSELGSIRDHVAGQGQAKARLSDVECQLAEQVGGWVGVGGRAVVMAAGWSGEVGWVEQVGGGAGLVGCWVSK